jgi:type II secretory ATPase GspE/PulE/Tfp pilus assembly ATPase PilB-like protein
MSRRAVAFATLLPLVTAARAWADGGWPDPLPPDWGQRGAGGGLALVPLALWCLCLLGWVATVEWGAGDARVRNDRPALWSTLLALPFAVCGLLAWWIPSAIAALALMLLAWGAPVLAYLTLRDKRLPKSQRLLTVRGLLGAATDLLEPFGVKLPKLPDAEDNEESLPDVQLVAAGGRDADEDAAREHKAAAKGGLVEARSLLQTAVIGRAATVLIEPDPQGILVRHEVDGVWEPPRVRRPPRTKQEKETFMEAPRPTREVAQAVMASLTALCGLSSRSRSGKSGTFLLQVDGKPRHCRVAFNPASGGEQLVLQIEPPATTFKTPGDIGMPAALATRLTGLLAVEKGLILVTAPPAGGLSTTFDVVVQMADRMLRDFISLDDAAETPREIQNVRPVRFDARTGVAPLDALRSVMKEHPRAIVTRDLRDRGLAAELVRLAGEQQLVIASLPAAAAVEAVGGCEALGVTPDQLARTLVGVLAQRLIRKLCPKCRREYPTPGEVLARLKVTAEQLPHLWRPSDHGCRVCRGTGYFGRTAVFELAAGKAFRQAIAARADSKSLRKAAVADGMLPLREAGLALVSQGITSLEELQRVFSRDRGEQGEGRGR